MSRVKKDRKKVMAEKFKEPKAYHEIKRPLKSVKDVGFCETQNAGYREEMEDGHCIIDSFRNNLEGYFAVYDGHGGRTSVDYVEKHLHKYFHEGLRICKSIRDAYVYAYKKTDKNLGNLNVGHCGATSIACFLTHTKLKKSGKIIKKIHTSNCGDARAVLSRNGVAQRLSYDHKSTDPYEQKRVEDTGGVILADRVSGVLAVSRSFGDIDYKKWVVSDPFYTEVRLKPSDDILIIACDGVWDVVEDQEAIDLIKKKQNAEEMAKYLVEVSLEKGSMDNISCMIVIL